MRKVIEPGRGGAWSRSTRSETPSSPQTDGDDVTANPAFFLILHKFILQSKRHEEEYGPFGQVLEVVKRDCGKHYAMKVMRKEIMRRCLGSSWRKKIHLEKDLMASLNHPFLVNLSTPSRTPSSSCSSWTSCRRATSPSSCSRRSG